MKITSAARVSRMIHRALFALAAGSFMAPLTAQTWNPADIGSVAATGSSSGSGSNHTVNGSGADIWETSDEFHFRYLTWTGDGTFTARVTGMTNTDMWAKAGIMLRESLTPGSRHVTLGVNPGTAAGLFARTATNGPTDFALGIYEIPQMWIRLQRRGGACSAYQSADGVTWYQVGSAATVNLPATLYAGLAVTSHRDGVLCTATFSDVSFVATGGSPPPPPADGTFVSADIGAVGAAGSTSVSGGVYTVRGAGEDVYGPADEFHFHYRPWTGDGVFIVRVTSVELTFNWAKAGIMIRTDLSTNAQQAFAFVTPERNTALVYRTTAGGLTTGAVAVADSDKAMPMWLKLTREGDQLAMDFSSDGSNWRRRGSTTMAFPPTVYVGLAVSSHVDATLGTATFDNFSLSAVTPAALDVVAHAPNRIDLKWQDNDLDETGYEVERATDTPTGFVRIGTLAANVTTLSDTTVAPSTTYYYRIRSISAAGPSGYSNVTSETTPPPPPAGWSSQDVGDTSIGGRSREVGGVFTISGSGSGVGGVRYYRASSGRGDFGADVPGYSDEFQYCWKPWSGDGEMIARVTSLAGSSTGHAGITVRVSAAASAYNVFCYVSPGGGLGVMTRPGTSTHFITEYRNQTFPSFSTTQVTVPRWLKVVRSGGGVMSFTSADGVNWTELAWVTTPLTADVQFGFAVSSQEDGNPPALPALLTANFDHVSVGPVTTPIPPLAPPTNGHASQVLQEYISIAWTKATPSYDGTEVQWSTDGVNFTTVSTTSVELSTFSSLHGDTNYYFRLRTRRGTAVSVWTDVLRVRTAGYAAAPTNVAATALSQREIRVTWNENATNENGFFLESSLDGVNFTWVASPAANTTSTVVGDLNAATKYYFRLIAYPYDPNNRGYSNVASATTFAFGTLPNAPTNLAATATSANRVDLTWADNSADETGFSVVRSTDNVNFAFLLHAGANITTASDTSTNGSTTYYYRVYAINDNGGSAYANTAGLTTPATPPTGSGWQGRDIGDVASGGGDSESGGVVTMTGAGADIWNLADEFHYRFQPWTGDGEIIARVTGLTDTNGWAKAGVTFRETLSANSRHASMIVSVAHGTALQYRTVTGGETASSAPSEAGGVQAWVRLVRTGNSFTGYASPDGVTWTLAGTVTLNLPTTVYAGLVVTSHNDGVLSTATFEHVSISGGTPPTPPPNPPTNLAASAVSASQINVTWTNASDNESGFEVESSTDNATYTRLTSTTANVTSYSHLGLNASTTYFYRVRAVNAAGVSSYAGVISATTPAGPPPPSGGTWQSQDVGAVVAAGSSSESGGTVTLRASGADIWDSTDEFHYRYQSWTGDGELVARVTGMTPFTHEWAKAGVMFRESLAAGARHAFMCISAARGLAFQYRAATGGLSASVPDGGTGISPLNRWLKLVRSGSTLTGYYSVDGVNWTFTGTATIAMPATIYVGLAATSHNDGVLVTATFESVNLAGGAAPPPPEATWSFSDIGAVGVAGSNTSAGNTITINASGADIWDKADAFRFVYRTVTGDCVVEANVSSLTSTHPWAKAGVMIRESTAAGARNVFAFLTPASGVVAQQRAAAGGATIATNGPWWVGAPYWVRLVRAGSRITAFSSTDGKNWAQFAAYDVTMGATAQVGFALTSHDNSQLGSAVFADPYVQ